MSQRSVFDRASAMCAEARLLDPPVMRAIFRPEMSLRRLLLTALLSSAACVELKEHPSTDAADGAAGDAGDVPRSDAEGETGTTGTPSIATVGDTREASEFTISNDVVVDSKTGLHWQKELSSASANFPEAKSVCAALRTEGTSDWRLPTKIELLSLVDYSNTNSHFLAPAFADLDSIRTYWSGDEVLRIGPVHPIWTVAFWNLAATATKDPNPGVDVAARCVRGTKLPRASLVREGEVVRDKSSGLVWEATRSPSELDEKKAFERCAALSLSGVSGFRMPTMKELISLLEDDRTAAPFVSDLFDEPRGGTIWSSTLVKGQSMPEAVAFDNGQLASSAPVFARCVK